MSDEKLRSELGLTPDEERLISLAPSFGAPDASGRLEARFDSEGEFHLIDYKATPAGGMLYSDALGEIFMEMDVVREFSLMRPLRRIEIRPCVLETLLAGYREWGGRDQPHIAIVVKNEPKALAEMEICREYLEIRGYPAIIADPNELEYRGGWLRVRDFRVNLIYRRVCAAELLSTGGLGHPLIRATKDRAVCVINSFRSLALMKRTLFAMLDDPRYEDLFSSDELETLRRRIPWTRVLREGFTTYGSEQVDLIEFIAGRRENFILKPNDDHGSKGVVCGWQCEADEWRRAINNALDSSYVAQERVGSMLESFPTLSEGQVSFEDRRVDFSHYTWLGDDVAGAGVRLSSSAAPGEFACVVSTTPMLIY